MTIKINEQQRLYVIPCGGGFTCLGFDNLERRAAGYADWLAREGLPVTDPAAPIGTVERYEQYQAMTAAIRATCKRCDAELTPQLVGLEGWRVEVVTDYGERRRFIVGKSTGFIPIHLEIANRRSHGGQGAESSYASVKPLYNASARDSRA